MNDALFTRSPLFARIAPDDLRALVRAAQRRTFGAGQVLFHRGDEADGVYGIVSGRLRVYAENADGDEAVIAIRGAGEVLGEMALLDGFERSASVSAVDAVEAAWISRGDFDVWLQEHPAAMRAMLVELARRLREATDQVAEMALLDIETRLARRLWMEFCRAGSGEPAAGARLHVHQGEMAALLGVTRESVNKHLARLKSRGAVAVESGTVVLIAPDVLRAAADAL